MMNLGKTFTNTMSEHLERIEKIIADAMVTREKTTSEASDKIAEYKEKLSKFGGLEKKFAELEVAR